MKATRPGHLPAPSPASASQRTCAEPGCDTKLSIYNAGSHCWQHSDVVFPNYRGKRLREGRP
jgi:hypothetical protein